MKAERYSHLVTFPQLPVNYLMDRVSSTRRTCNRPHPSAPPISTQTWPPKCIPKLTQSWQPSVFEKTVAHGLHGLSKCISELTRSQPPSVSLTSSLDRGLRVYLQVPLITPSKWISKLTQLKSPSVHDHGLCKCISNSLNRGLGVYLCVH